MELQSRGSKERNRLGKRHGLEPLRSAVEHWIAKARHSFVANLHFEAERSPAVRSASLPGPNVKVQLDPKVAGHRDLQCAPRCQTDAGRDADPRQTTWDGCHWPVHAEQGASPVRLKALGPSPPEYPDDCRWPVDAEPVASRETLKALPLRCQVYPNATSGKLAYRSDDRSPNDCCPEDAARNA